ncbi:accessory gene regulator B family protein [Paenibacillus aquistagni]|uniref:accessory gene regulator B family protein n=1 Tax=Paenibacillus aquistagni TaxID=1852522 RepID=UPI001482589D
MGESLIALISISVLRRFSGGVHFRSLTHCMLVTSLTCTLIPMISLSKGTLMLLASISLVFMLIFPETPIHSRMEQICLKSLFLKLWRKRKRESNRRPCNIILIWCSLWYSCMMETLYELGGKYEKSIRGIIIRHFNNWFSGVWRC